MKLELGHKSGTKSYTRMCSCVSLSLQLFTSLVPFALGVFNQDISAKVRLQRPSLYRPSQENKGFNSKVKVERR